MSTVLTSDMELSSGFVELLLEVVDRTREHCIVLQRLESYLARRGTDRHSQLIGKRLVEFFDVFFEQWQRAEERLLLPALLASTSGSESLPVRKIIARIMQEHRDLHERWIALRPALEDLGTSTRLLTIETRAPSLVGLLHTHLLRKEMELLPILSRLLSQSELRSIEYEMRAHCG